MGELPAIVFREEESAEEAGGRSGSRFRGETVADRTADERILCALGESDRKPVFRVRGSTRVETPVEYLPEGIIDVRLLGYGVSLFRPGSASRSIW